MRTSFIYGYMNKMMTNWRRLYARTIDENLLRDCRAIVAYNEVIDKICELQNRDIFALRFIGMKKPSRAILESIEEFTFALDNSLKNGVACELHACDELFEILERRFSYHPRIGGQAAIIGSLISRFSGRPAIIHPDRMGIDLLSFLDKEELLVPIGADGKIRLAKPHKKCCLSKSETHLVFEFSAGQPAISSGICPRDNRLIIDPISAIRFDPDFEEALPTISRMSDVLIIAGIDQMGKEYRSSFDRIISHIEIAKRSNPAILTHLEITSMQSREKIRAVLEEILPIFDSIGLNEVELRSLISTMNKCRKFSKEHLSPEEQIDAANILSDLGVKRIHIHTLGYHLRIGKTNSIASTIKSLIFSSAIGCTAAMIGKIPYPKDIKNLLLSPSMIGLEVVNLLKSRLLHSPIVDPLIDGKAEGIICVPAPIIESPRLTVGLGDCISGACVAAEKMQGAI